MWSTSNLTRSTQSWTRWLLLNSTSAFTLFPLRSASHGRCFFFCFFKPLFILRSSSRGRCTRWAWAPRTPPTAWRTATWWSRRWAMGPRRTGRATSSFSTERLSSRRASGWKIRRMRVNLGEAKHVNPSTICRRNAECPHKSFSMLHVSTRYDFWYQPYHNVMISTEWGHPRSFFQGLNMEHVEGVRHVGYCNFSQFLTQMSGPLWHPPDQGRNLKPKIKATVAPIWTHQGHYGTHLNEPIRATMAPIWTSTTGPQGSFCRRSTSAWRASCPWRSGDVWDFKMSSWNRCQIMMMLVAKLKRMFEIHIRWPFRFPSCQSLLPKIFSRWRLLLRNSRQIIYLELSSGSCTTPRQLLVLSAALSSQTCSGSSKLRRFMHIPFIFIVIVFKTDKDLACFCWC